MRPETPTTVNAGDKDSGPTPDRPPLAVGEEG
jgi:hypothetical protein